MSNSLKTKRFIVVKYKNGTNRYLPVDPIEDFFCDMENVIGTPEIVAELKVILEKTIEGYHDDNDRVGDLKLSMKLIIALSEMFQGIHDSEEANKW